MGAFIDAMEECFRPLTRFLLCDRVPDRGGDRGAGLRPRPRPAHRVDPARVERRGEHGVYLGSTKSRRGVRTIVLTGAIVAELGELTLDRPADALVFTTVTGQRIQAQHYRNRQWARALERAGITHITTHGLRHNVGVAAARGWSVVDRGAAPVGTRVARDDVEGVRAPLTDAQAGAAAVMERATAGRLLEP